MKNRSGRLEFAATDLANFLKCRHLTELDRGVAEGRHAAPGWRDPNADVLAERGLRHERAYVEDLRASGREVIDLRDVEGSDGLDRTRRAMQAGADIIAQAALSKGHWSGRADLLERVDGVSELGDWRYEVIDTKLALETRGGTLLQLALYADLLTPLQGSPAAHIHVVKPDRSGRAGDEPFVRDSFRFADLAAYYRVVRSRLEEALHESGQSLTPTYPEPVPHCDVCRWWQACNRRRRDDDHLSLVAGLGRLHAEELRRQGRATRRALGEAATALEDAPRHGRRATYDGLRDQAAIQLRGEDEKRPVHELLPLESDRGLSRLPRPSAGDIFLDFEGDPFVDAPGGGGLEYLLGYVTAGAGGVLQYSPHWAFERGSEKRAFEAFIDTVESRLAEHSNLYIYHFAPYEPAALKRLASRHATRENELDRLLRGDRFIDLHAVTREALRASVESYSLKQLEPLCGFERTVDLRSEAGPALRRVQHALELGRSDDVSPADCATVAGYNKDDCLALIALRGWLEERRAEVTADGTEIARPPIKDGAPTEKVDKRAEESREVVGRLTHDVPCDPEERTEEQAGRWLLAHLVEYFRRESKVGWWEFYARREADEETLLADRKAIVGLEFVEELPLPSNRHTAVVHRYSFVPQEVSLKPGTKIADPRKRDGEDALGTIAMVDAVRGLVDIKTTKKTVDRRPTALHDADHVPAETLAASLLDLARWVAEHGLEAESRDYRAERDLLLARPPRRHDSKAPLRAPDEPLDLALKRSALALDGGVLPIQGPPGTGKTYNGARMILALARGGKRVGISAVSHEVIKNMLREVREVAHEVRATLETTHKLGRNQNASTSPHAQHNEVKNDEETLGALDLGHVVGATAWLWAKPIAADTLDYLVIDEAGQLSLAHVLAAARSARNLILLGDPQQLQQPQRGAHPEGAEISALSHILGDEQTLSDERGFFLAETWRLHPAICAYTSELFYEDRLRPHPHLSKQRLDAPGFATHGLTVVPALHENDQSRSETEVDIVEGLVGRLLAPGTSWTDQRGIQRHLTDEDILVIAPYNAQVAALSDRLAAHRVRVGTVDRFQGQQAPVVIYSMTSSSVADAPRGLSFLFDPHRLNVATSRARCLCVLVANPALFAPECKTPEQMRWANALCRFQELA